MNPLVIGAGALGAYLLLKQSGNLPGSGTPLFGDPSTANAYNRFRWAAVTKLGLQSKVTFQTGGTQENGQWTIPYGYTMLGFADYGGDPHHGYGVYRDYLGQDNSIKYGELHWYVVVQGPYSIKWGSGYEGGVYPVGTLLYMENGSLATGYGPYVAQVGYYNYKTGGFDMVPNSFWGDVVHWAINAGTYIGDHWDEISTGVASL